MEESNFRMLYSTMLKRLKEIQREDDIAKFINNSGEENFSRDDKDELEYVNKKASKNGYRYTYDKYNDMHILYDEHLKNDENLYRSSANFDTELNDFINLLEVLIKLDEEFVNNIREYLSISKEEKDYLKIQENLFAILKYDSNNISESSKHIYLLRLALSDVFNKINKKYPLSKMYIIFYNKLFTYISNYYDDILQYIAEYHISALCKVNTNDNFINSKEFIREKVNQRKPIKSFLKIDKSLVFLSYAIKDRFFSLLLYIEALDQGITLFIDWMFTSQINDPKLLKINLGYFLSSADKLVFLQSIQSELNLYPQLGTRFNERQKMVRQWCAGEIGFFYNNYYNSKTNHKIFRYMLNKDVIEDLKEHHSTNVRKPNKVLREENVFLSDITVIESLKEIYGSHSASKSP